MEVPDAAGISQKELSFGPWCKCLPPHREVNQKIFLKIACTNLWPPTDFEAEINEDTWEIHQITSGGLYKIYKESS